MDKLKDLKDLLRHEVLDLVSAEDQLIEGMPAMIERATNPDLKRALTEHLKVTERQRKRLDQVNKLLGEENGEDGSKVGNFISGLFGGGEQKCKAMEGIIAEGNKMMKEDMNEEVMDAAIISCSQKIEHYEICGYGTAKAFARELQLTEVENLLNETLNEEYEADNRLTKMAVGGGINEMAERADEDGGGKSQSGRGGSGNKKASSSGKKSSSASSSQSGKKSSTNNSTSGKKSSSSNSAQAGKKSSGGNGSSGGKGGASSSSNGSSSSGKKSSAGTSSSGKKGASGSNNSGKKSSSSGGNSSKTSGSSGSSNSVSSAKGASKSGAGGSSGRNKSASGGKKASASKGGASKGGGRGR